MRKIKFRAWDKGSQTMLYYAKNPDTPNMTLDGVCIHWNDGSNVSYQYILMQYTGLLDKQGKEIYEGDTVMQEMPSNEIWKGKVVFEQGAFRINTKTVFNKELIGGLAEIIDC